MNKRPFAFAHKSSANKSVHLLYIKTITCAVCSRVAGVTLNLLDSGYGKNVVAPKIVEVAYFSISRFVRCCRYGEQWGVLAARHTYCGYI